MATLTMTCHSAGCMNAEIAMEINWSDDPDLLRPQPPGMCGGGCGVGITDFVWDPVDDPYHPPAPEQADREE
jgi:hypothetical protein